LLKVTDHVAFAVTYNYNHFHFVVFSAKDWRLRFRR